MSVREPDPRGARRLARALALSAAFASVAALAYFAGGPYGRDAISRAIEVQELPVGALGRQIELDLPTLPAGPVRNLIVMIGDGMGIAQIQAARLAAYGPDARFVFERFPVVGLAATSSASSPVGESAASATAIASGVKTDHGRVGTTPDGRPVGTLAEAARDAGFAVGLVTTSAITDATPAAFAAHVDARSEQTAIALQLSGANVDLLIGGGREQFRSLLAGGRRSDRRDLLAEAAARGVTVVDTAEALRGATSLPLWAFVDGRPDRPGGDPPLELWSERAVALLTAEGERRGRGFLLMIEEEGIDSGAHKNDFAALARAALRFDAAVAVAARFAAADGATLLVVTGDHPTGGLTIDSTTDARTVRVAWASAHHSGEPVPVYAYGPADATARFGGTYHQLEIGRRAATLLGFDLSTNWKDEP